MNAEDELRRDLELVATGKADAIDLVARHHGITREEAKRKLQQMHWARQGNSTD